MMNLFCHFIQLSFVQSHKLPEILCSKYVPAGSQRMAGRSQVYTRFGLCFRAIPSVTDINKHTILCHSSSSDFLGRTADHLPEIDVRQEEHSGSSTPNQSIGDLSTVSPLDFFLRNWDYSCTSISHDSSSYLTLPLSAVRGQRSDGADARNVTHGAD